MLNPNKCFGAKGIGSLSSLYSSSKSSTLPRSESYALDKDGEGNPNSLELCVPEIDPDEPTPIIPEDSAIDARRDLLTNLGENELARPPDPDPDHDQLFAITSPSDVNDDLDNLRNGKGLGIGILLRLAVFGLGGPESLQEATRKEA